MKSKGNRSGSKEKQIPGPKPKILKINDDWEEAVKKSLVKKKPKDGWPK